MAGQQRQGAPACEQKKGRGGRENSGKVRAEGRLEEESVWRLFGCACPCMYGASFSHRGPAAGLPQQRADGMHQSVLLLLGLGGQVERGSVLGGTRRGRRGGTRGRGEGRHHTLPGDNGAAHRDCLPHTMNSQVGLTLFRRPASTCACTLAMTPHGPPWSCTSPNSRPGFELKKKPCCQEGGGCPGSPREAP